MAALPVGSVVAGYPIEGLLGHGGMGIVYRAHRPEFGDAVALKVIAAEVAGDPVFRERFRREARAAAALDHPHVVQVLDAGEVGGTLYLALQLIEGVDLATLIEHDRVLDPHLAVRVLSHVASGLDAAHATGLVHRDVKPANVLVEQRPDGPHAYLTDFGVARRLQERSRLTRTGMVVGTPGYLAPEALRGEGAGPGVDIYALGCVLFEALTGAPPFERENNVALILAHVEDPPPSLAVRVPGLPAALDQVVHRALAKDPAGRFSSASAFARAAQGALRGWDALKGSASTEAASGTIELALPSASRARSTAVRKQIALLYATPGVDMGSDPELRLATAQQFERLVRPILERYGATIEASPTEGVLAVFGLPTLHEDDATRGVRAALALNDELGPAAGGVFAPTSAVVTDVVLTGGETPSPTAFGGLLERAFRVLGAAAPGEVLITAATRDLAPDAASYEAVGAADSAEPLWRANSAASDRADGSASQRSLVGREYELELLQRFLSEAIDVKSARLATIVGSPGIGKSRLANAFAQAISRRASVAVTRCRPAGEADSREPVRELIDRLAGADPSAFLLETLDGDDAEAIAERVERLLARRQGTVPADELPWVVRRFLSNVARQQPVVILIEDVHWAEPALLELVEHVAEWTTDSPLMLVCTARPELLDDRPDWGEGTKDIRIVLDPLSPEASHTLVDGLQDAAELTDLMRERIVQLAEGNPLFVEQMVAFMRDRPNRGDAVTVPPNIHSVVAARLDRLQAEQRDVISHAAIIGREFSVAALDELGAGAPPQTLSVLHDLDRKELIEATASAEVFRFRHALIRDAAYESVPKVVRAQIHESHAQWLHAAGDSDEAVGYHLEQAVHVHEQLGSPDAQVGRLATRAGERLGSAGRSALGRGEVETAAALLDRASALFGADTPQALALTPYLGHAMAMSGSAEAAYRLLVDAEPVAEELDPVLAMHLAVAHRHVGLMADPALSLDEILRTCERAVEVFDAHEDVVGLAFAWSLKAWAHLNQGRLALAGETAERGIEMARRASMPMLEALALENVSMALLDGPTPARRAIARGTELLNSVQGKRRYVLGIAVNVACLHAMAGAFDEARRLIGISQDIVEELKIGIARAATALMAAEVEMLSGNPCAAERILRPEWELVASASRGDLAYLLAALARSLEAQQRWSEAERLTEEAEVTAFEEDVVVQADWRATRATLLARRGDHVPAEALAREAVALSRTTDALSLQGDCARALAEVLRSGGKLRQASRAAEDALTAFTAKENVVCARRVQALMHELEESRA
jgi:tetratricopeptide (TPR) repeat protein